MGTIALNVHSGIKGLKERLQQNMSKSCIHQLSFPVATQDVFVKTPDGGLRFCNDYQDFNCKVI